MTRHGVMESISLKICTMCSCVLFSCCYINHFPNSYNSFIDILDGCVTSIQARNLDVCDVLHGVIYKQCIVNCHSHPSHLGHDEVIKWKHFPRNWPFVRGIHRSPVNSPHKGQWRGALMFSLICVWINGWINNREAGDFRRCCAHYDLMVMHTNVLYPQYVAWFPATVLFADEHYLGEGAWLLGPLLLTLFNFNPSMDK